MGSHSETIQIDYDPTIITYQQLLDVFWNSHNPVGRALSRQYASIIFYHDEAQRQAAQAAKEQERGERGRAISTEILPYTRFWLAEDYHQKHSLRGSRGLAAEYEALYPDSSDFIDSTAVARVNGYVGGNGTLEQLEEEIDELGLSAAGRKKLLEIGARRLR